jgi:hypothetical protein
MRSTPGGRRTTGRASEVRFEHPPTRPITASTLHSVEIRPFCRELTRSGVPKAATNPPQSERTRSNINRQQPVDLSTREANEGSARPCSRNRNREAAAQTASQRLAAWERNHRPEAGGQEAVVAYATGPRPADAGDRESSEGRPSRLANWSRCAAGPYLAGGARTSGPAIWSDQRAANFRQPESDYPFRHANARVDDYSFGDVEGVRTGVSQRQRARFLSPRERVSSVAGAALWG